VVRYTKDGSPYRVPPYSRAEWEEMMRTINNPPISYLRSCRAAQSPQDQEPPEPPPADTRPERKQP
jgi:hypothetical protein